MRLAIPVVAPRIVRATGSWLQWSLLLLMTLSLTTQAWHRYPWAGWVLLAIATLAWAPQLRSGYRRWWFVYVGGIYVYTLLRALADDAIFPVQTSYVASIDRTLFGGLEPVVWLQSRFFSPVDVDVIDILATQIHWSFFVVPHALAVGVYIWNRPLFSRYVTLLLGVQFIALLFFFLVPTAPPWLASQYGDIERVYRVMNFVGQTVDGETYRTLYSALGEPNSVAAVPSIHMGVTFAVYLWSRRHLKPVAPLMLVYSIVMGLSLVHLAEHYVFDLLVGIVLALLVDQFVTRRWAVETEEVAAARLGPGSVPASG